MKAPSLVPAIVAADPRVDIHWQQLAASGGSVFTSPPWIRAVCDSYGFSPQARMTLDDNGVPRDGFAWVEIDDLRGHRLVSLPFSDRAEPVVSEWETWPSLVADALEVNAPFTMRCLDGAPPTGDPRFERVSEAAWHGTAVDVPVHELLRSLHPSGRRAVAAAERRGVEVRACTDIEAVRTFHQMHVRLRKGKYRLLAQSVEFFERIWAEFSRTDAIITLLALADGEPIAGAVLLVWGDTLYFKFAASRSDSLHLMPNYAVYWNTIKLASERGLRLVDWGLSDLDQPGLVDYKRKWASRESRIVTLRRTDFCGGEPLAVGGSPSEAGTLLARLTQILTDETVPDAISARAGSLLYRYFA